MLATELTYTTRTTCRVCGGGVLIPLFSLGSQFVSDFVDRDQIHAGIACPIVLVQCPQCTLVQALHTAPQELLYRRHYWYRSSTTQTMRDALRDVAQAAERLVDLKPGDVVLDIGSNTGDLLRSYTAPGIIRVGVEPAENLAEEGSRGVDCLIRDFWSYEAYRDADRYSRTYPDSQAAVITALGMFYDLEDPNAFIRDIARVLAPDGVFIAQLMCARQMLELGDVGNLVAEHLEFYTLKSLAYLFGKCGLEIFKVEENNVNGGSYRLFMRHDSDQHRTLEEATGSKTVRAESYLDDPAFYRRFFTRIDANRRRTVEYLREMKGRGKRIYGYGASTKGNVIAQFYSLTPDLIDAVADRSPEKVGKYMVGSGLRICSEEEARAANPDFFFVFPFAFREEFLEREKAWRAKGGRFIFPLPELEIV